MKKDSQCHTIAEHNSTIELSVFDWSLPSPLLSPAIVNVVDYPLAN